MHRCPRLRYFGWIVGSALLVSIVSCTQINRNFEENDASGSRRPAEETSPDAGSRDPASGGTDDGSDAAAGGASGAKSTPEQASESALEPETEPAPLAPAPGPTPAAVTEPGPASEPAPTSEPEQVPEPASEPEPATEPEQVPEPASEPEPVSEPPSPTWPSECPASSGSEYDPVTGITWTTLYTCGSNSGASVYEKPNFNDAVGIMDSSSSTWFVCWSTGASHSGQNNIWYYTQGDRATSGWGHRAGWGFMPAVDVHTENDPDSGVPQCSF